jgi:hypothetical protein
LRAWIAGFRWLHEKARLGSLTGEEAVAYREAREDLAAMLVAAQRLTLNPGQTGREALRVARALPLELQLKAGAVRGETLDISTGGFSTILKRALQPDETVAFTLALGSGPLPGRARVASVSDQDGFFRVSFRLEGLSPAEMERMGSEVLDATLVHLANLIEQA